MLLAPQYNTWGVESAKAMPPEEFDEGIVLDTFHWLQASGMKARTFVIDDKWEGRYGELRHDEDRFPNFVSLLETIRQSGYFIGLWAAFLRCQDRTALGLYESHLLQTPNGGPLWLSHQTARYGIFDVTQPEVQHVLKERAREFIRTYRPDLVKFDFGYELPSLDTAAPADRSWCGERLLQKGLEVIVGAMKEENPDLVIMYYGLSPLLLDYYDLHSLDDLVYCNYVGKEHFLRPEVELIDRANQLALTAPEMTVLVGGMRALGANYQDSKLGLFVASTGALTNEWFVNLLDMSTEWKKSGESDYIYAGHDRKTGAPKWTASSVDLVFGSNSELRALAEVYARDGAKQKFVDDFVAAWTKVMNLDRFELKAPAAGKVLKASR